MPSPPSIHTSLYSLPSAPGTPTSFESTFESFGAPGGRGPKVLNGRLVKSKPRQPTQSTSGRSLPPSTLCSPSEGMEDQREEDRDEYDGVNRDNDNDNQNVHVNGNGHLNATQEPQKHSKHSRDKEVKPTSGNKIWRLMKRISTGGLRDKYALHSPSFSMSSSSGKGSTVQAGGGSTRSLSRAAQLRMTKLSNYSEESLACSHRSHGSYGSLVASSSHTSHASHGEPGPGPGFNTFNHDHVPPPVPAIPKDLQNALLHSSPSSPASFSSNEPGSNMSRKQHRRDRDSRSASSPIPSISSPLSPGQYSSASHSSATSSSSPHTPTSPSPSAPGKKRILSRISSMGLLRRKPSIASGLASSLGFGAPGTLDKAEKNEKMENNGRAVAVQEVPASFTIPTIPSTPPNNPSKSKSTKYSISCIPIPSIPSMPSMSIIASSTPSTPIRSTTQVSSVSFSSSSSRPGTGKTTLSQSSSASSPRLSLDSRSRLAMQSGRRRRSKSMSRSRSRSNSLDSLGHHDYTTPKKKNSNYDQDRDNHRNNNNHNRNMPATTTNDHPYPLAKHIVPPLELSATLDDNRWGIEHVISGDDDQASSSSVSLPIEGQRGNGSLSRPEGRRSVDPGLGPKRVNRTINNRSTGSKEDSKVKVNKREERMDKWERLLERRDKLELDKLDGLRSKGPARGRESWTIARSPEEELPSLPVPPRKRTKEKEKEKETSREEKWERSASVDVPASPVSSSPVYRGRAIVDDIPAPSTFGRVMGKQIEAEGSMEETRRSSLSPIQGRASFSVVGNDGRKKNGRDGSRQRRSLSAVRSPSALISSPDSQTVPSPRSWTKSLSSPILRKNSKNAAAVVSTATPPAAATPPRALGTLLRKLSFSGVSASPASGIEKRRNRSPKRPSTASSSVSSAKARSVSISGKSGFFWNGDSSKQGELESLPLPRRLLRKNSLLKGRSNTGNQDMPTAPGTRRPRTADASSSGTLTEKEKRERWENLLERSEKAGGTIHLRANGEGLLSDRMRMSMVSMASEAGVQEE